MDDSSGLHDDPEQLQAAIEEAEEKEAALQFSIAQEDAKRERCKVTCLVLWRLCVLHCVLTTL